MAQVSRRRSCKTLNQELSGSAELLAASDEVRQAAREKVIINATAAKGIIKDSLLGKPVLIKAERIKPQTTKTHLQYLCTTLKIHSVRSNNISRIEHYEILKKNAESRNNKNH